MYEVLHGKNRSKPSFGWEVKPEVPCCKILRCVKDTSSISGTDRQNSHSFVHSSYLPQMSLLVGLPEFWWTSQELFPAGIIIITMALHVHISSVE
jgi:hypothetical protein